MFIMSNALTGQSVFPPIHLFNLTFENTYKYFIYYGNINQKYMKFLNQSYLASIESVDKPLYLMDL